jgi:hypothetical protein
MDETGLAEEIEDMNVFSTLENVIYKMEILPPDGATIHRKNNIMGILKNHAKHVENGRFPREYSFRQFEAECPEVYGCIVTELNEAATYFNIRI